MARKFIKPVDDKGKSLRINERIRISPIRLIDHNDEQVGIVDTYQALNMAREAGLDLVEVAPASRPPVCKIMDYGKWKYQQSKKEQKAKSNTKQTETKEVRFRPKTDTHDKQIKVDHARAFLEEGNKVQLTMMFKGREMAHRDLGMAIFQGLIADFADIARVETPPRAMGRRMSMLLAPVAKQSVRKPKPKVAPDTTAVKESPEPTEPAAIEQEASEEV